MQRLGRLSPGHPSSPDYHLGQDGRLSRQVRDAGDPAADRWRPATERPEWQGPLSDGEVDSVGKGVVDERARQFSPGERRIADFLARPGAAVQAVHEGYGRQGRRPDAYVDGVPTEFKSLDPGASDRTVLAALNRAKGQAPHAVIDSRGSGLSEPDASHGLSRFLGTPWAHRIDTARIIGEGFDVQWKRGY